MEITESCGPPKADEDENYDEKEIIHTTEESSTEFIKKFENIPIGVLNKMSYDIITEKFKKCFPRFQIEDKFSIKKISREELLDKFSKTFDALQHSENFIFLTYQNLQKICFIDCFIDSSDDSIMIHYKILANLVEDLAIAKEKLFYTFSDILIENDLSYMRVSWYYHDSKNILRERMFTEKLDDVLYDESYPGLNISDLRTNYLISTEPLLILIGPPGTGKTRLIRYIIQKIAKERVTNVANILYTSDRSTVEKGELFISWLLDGYDALVLEDIDEYLGKRESGNIAMYHLLSISNGLSCNLVKKKKIILSTNLPSLESVDPALIRSGRCFKIIKTRKLDKQESMNLLKVLNPKIDYVTSSIVTRDSISIADIYKLAKNGKLEIQDAFEKTGFE